MSRRLEEILSNPEMQYLINNANNIENIQKYLPILSELAKKVKKHNTWFIEGLARYRVPYKDIEKYIDLDEILIDNCSIVGNIEIIRQLRNQKQDYQDYYVSSVIDIVCKTSEKTLEQTNKIEEYLTEKKYKYRFLPPDIYVIEFKSPNIKIPNQFGVYRYIDTEIEKQNLRIYFLIAAENNIIIRRNSIIEVVYIENFALFSLLFKFYRYTEKDKKDLEKYEKSREGLEKIIDKGFHEKDLEKIMKIFGKEERDKIMKKIKSYVDSHPDTIYKKLLELNIWFYRAY